MNNRYIIAFTTRDPNAGVERRVEGKKNMLRIATVRTQRTFILPPPPNNSYCINMCTLGHFFAGIFPKIHHISCRRQYECEWFATECYFECMTKIHLRRNERKHWSRFLFFLFFSLAECRRVTKWWCNNPNIVKMLETTALAISVDLPFGFAACGLFVRTPYYYRFHFDYSGIILDVVDFSCFSPPFFVPPIFFLCCSSTLQFWHVKWIIQSMRIHFVNHQRRTTWSRRS